MRYIVIIALAATLMGGLFYTPKAQAFVDPVTIAILAPLALKAAQIAAPYVIRGLVGGGQGLLTMGGDVIDILRLPLGVLQATLFAPFGFLGDGFVNMFKGGVAPFKLAWDALLLPVRFCGVGI